MRRSREKTVAFVMVLLLALPVLAIAQGKRGQGEARWDGERPFGPFARLDLSEEQKEKIEGIMSRVDDEALSLRKEMMRARHDLRGAFLEESIDQAEIRKLVERIGELRTKMELRHIERRLAIREVLTEEQRDRLLLHGGRHLPGGPGCDGGRHGKGGQGRGWWGGDRHDRSERRSLSGGGWADCPWR